MINYWYQITQSENKFMSVAEVFANSDRLSHKVFDDYDDAKQWAEGFIEGFKAARGEYDE